jgi:P27 family predicted phage terminase small subunit
MKTPATLVFPGRMRANKSTPPPKHLERQERVLWNQIVGVYKFDDAASRSMLLAAMEAHQRARRCREVIDRDGETVTDRWGQLKPHPILNAERDARAAFIAAMKALNLDLGVAGK